MFAPRPHYLNINGLGMSSTRQGGMNKMTFTNFMKFAIMSLLRVPSRRSKRGSKYSQQELKGGSYYDITLMPVKHAALVVTNLASCHVLKGNHLMANVFYAYTYIRSYKRSSIYQAFYYFQ